MLLNIALYAVGLGAVLVTYLPFSPATIDLVLYSRDMQLAIFKRRRLFWAVGGAAFLVLLTKAALSGESLWLWIGGGTLAALAVMFWSGYVPIVMSPPEGRQVVGVEEGDVLLEPDDVVLGLYHDGEARAYPRTHIARPHFLPDEIQGDSLTISYCVLCNSGVAFRSELEGRPMDLMAVTAFNNNIIYLDKNSGNFIQQLEGKIIDGPDEGTRLDTVPLQIAKWKEWKDLHPDTKLVYAPAQSLRDRMVEVMLDLMVAIPELEARGEPFHRIAGALDDRLPAMSYVLGVEAGEDAVAFPVSELTEHPVVNETVAGESLAVFYQPPREVGHVFRRTLEGRKLTFRGSGAGPGEAVARDAETGTHWNISGEGVEGELVGTTLEKVPHWNHLFWFSWAAFHPDTAIWAPS